MSFEKAFEFMQLQEGHRIVHDPHDRGGRTYRGISERAHPNWIGWRYIDANDLKMADTLVPDFYRGEYWIEAGCNHLPEPLDSVVFDAAVHSGPSQSIRWLQRAVDAHIDGDLGPETLRAVENAVRQDGVEAVALETLMYRMTFMVRGFRLNRFSPRDQLRYLGGFWKRTLQLAYEVGDFNDLPGDEDE